MVQFMKEREKLVTSAVGIGDTWMSSEQETYSTQLLCPGGIYTYLVTAIFKNASLSYLAN
jgi:hypothetical protein